MKKVLTALLILSSFLFGTSLCFAAPEGNVFVGSDEADEIFEDMDLILEDVGLDVTQEEIEKHMDKIIREYVGVDILKSNIKSADEMRRTLKDADYIYILPIFTKNADYELFLQRGLPGLEGANLEEDRKEYVERRTGRWCVPTIGACEIDGDPPIPDYQENMDTFLKFYGIENSETFFLRGKKSNSRIMAVCFTEEGEKKDDGPYYVALNKINPAAKTKEEVERAVFTYDEMKEYAKANVPSGGGPGVTEIEAILILAGAVAAAAVIAAFVRKNRKRMR